MAHILKGSESARRQLASALTESKQLLRGNLTDGELARIELLLETALVLVRLIRKYRGG